MKIFSKMIVLLSDNNIMNERGNKYDMEMVLLVLLLYDDAV